MIAKIRKQDNNNSKGLVLLFSFSLLLKHLLCYTETGISKSRHWHLGISISVGINFTSQNVLWKNTPKNSLLYLVIQHQNPFTIVTYFVTISHSASTKLASKNIGLPGNFSRCLEDLFCREPVSASFCRKEIHRGGYLRNFKNMQGRKLQFAGL